MYEKTCLLKYWSKLSRKMPSYKKGINLRYEKIVVSMIFQISFNKKFDKFIS